MLLRLAGLNSVLRFGPQKEYCRTVKMGIERRTVYAKWQPLKKEIGDQPGDVLETIRPDPDSHYRLRPCKCGTPLAAVYERYTTKDGNWAWRVVCNSCGATVDLQGTVRHDVQVEWNRRNNSA